MPSSEGPASHSLLLGPADLNIFRSFVLISIKLFCVIPILIYPQPQSVVTARKRLDSLKSQSFVCERSKPHNG